MIEVKGLTKIFGDITAVNDISFKVKKGEVLGFLGPNGAGKTTTMRMLTCFSPATSGTATIGGYDIFDDFFEIKKILGYLPESPPLYLELTAREYLDYVSKLKGVAKSRRKSALDMVIDRCGLEKVIDRVLGNLSKGYRQRVGLAQALINDPEVIILDEPTSGLDPKQIIEIRELIKSLAGERTVILSTHILPEVTHVCQKIIVINEGNIIAEDTYEQLSARLKEANNTTLIVREPTVDLLDKISSVSGALSVTHDFDGNVKTIRVESATDIDLREELAKLVVASGSGLLELKHEAMSLEDVFLKLITKEDRTEN